MTILRIYDNINSTNKEVNKKRKLKKVRMDVVKYLASYENYRDVVLGMKKAARRRSTDSGDILPSVGVMAEFMDCDELEREYEKKKNILTYATKRLQRAISEISDPRLSDYLVCKYFYCMTNEEYAEQLGYCVRQVYRIATKAKLELSKHLKIRPPKARRWIRKGRFAYSKKRARKTHRKYGRKANKRG